MKSHPELQKLIGNIYRSNFGWELMIIGITSGRLDAAQMDKVRAKILGVIFSMPASKLFDNTLHLVRRAKPAEIFWIQKNQQYSP